MNEDTQVFLVPGADRDAEMTYGFAEDSGDTSFAVSWQPGNGTWYRVMFTPMTPSLVKAIGFDFGSVRGVYLVTWVLPGEQCQSYAFSSDGGFLSYKYVQEKMCFSRGSKVDASELTRIIGLALGRGTGLCTDARGEWIPKKDEDE